MTIKVNGEVVNVEENDELEVTTDVTAAELDEAVEVLEAKETLGSKIRNMPLWKKAVAVVGAVAGGAYIASKLGGHDDEDDEETEEETEENEEEEE